MAVNNRLGKQIHCILEVSLWLDKVAPGCSAIFMFLAFIEDEVGRAPKIQTLHNNVLLFNLVVVENYKARGRYVCF